jgi:opacity protein-like surface antigen
MIMNGKSLAAALLLGTFALSAQAQKPAIQWNQQYDFAAVDTFSWQKTDDTLESRNPFMHSLIKNTIEAELAESGLTQVDADPDVYVNYHASTTTEVQLRSDSYGYGFGGYGMGGWGYYGMGSMGTVSTTTRAVEYQRGTLVVDIWDAAKKELVWRGEVSDTLPDNPQKAEKLVVRAIGKMADQGRKLWAKEVERREKAASDGG